MANFDLYSYITRVLEINPRDISVQDDEGIDLVDYHSDSTFEEAKEYTDKELERMLEFLAKFKKKVTVHQDNHEKDYNLGMQQ